MKKLALIIFSLTVMALSNPCAVWEDAEWCASATFEDNRTFVFYGGPTNEINDMLKHPCGSSQAGVLVKVKESGSGYSVWRIGCRGTHEFIEVQEHAYRIIVYEEDKSVKHIISDKERVKKARQTIYETVEFIKSKRNDFEWNP